jgi:sodium-dependent dicarboxylate transporter 2/3/5
MKYTLKNWISIFAAIALTLVGKFISPIGSLSAGGNTSLFFMAGILVVILTESLPAGLLGFLCVVMLPLLGLTKNLNDAGHLFGGQLFFYMLACFALAVIMGKLPISKRILCVFLKLFNKSTRGTITALLLTTALISTFISDFPACLLMFFVSKQYIAMIEDEAERKQTRKSLYMGLNIAAHVGGICTPIGNSITALGTSYLAAAGYPIPFLQWVAFGLPIAVVLFPLSLFLLFKFLPPVEQSAEVRAGFIAKIKKEIPDKLSAQEIIAIVIMGITFICWVANFNIMLVTCLCGIFLLFPGFKLMSWKDYNDGTSWNSILITNALVAVATILQSTGVLDLFVTSFQTILPDTAGPLMIILLFGVFAAILLFILPNGPVIMAVMGATIITLATTIHIHPAALIVAFAVFTTLSIVVPTDALNLILYDGGNNFKASEMPKVGIPLVVVATVLAALWMPLMAKAFGM